MINDETPKGPYLNLARSNLRLALEDLAPLRARCSEACFGDDEWENYLQKLFDEQERLLSEALEALK